MADKYINGLPAREYKKRWEAESRRKKMRRDPISVQTASIYGNTMRRAKRKNLEFSLDQEWLREKISAGMCELTGVKFELIIGSPLVPSIDRIDNARGYTPENCRVIIWFANRAKSTLDDAQFLLLLKKTLRGFRVSRKCLNPWQQTT